MAKRITRNSLCPLGDARRGEHTDPGPICLLGNLAEIYASMDPVTLTTVVRPRTWIPDGDVPHQALGCGMSDREWLRQGGHDSPPPDERAHLGNGEVRRRR